MSAGRPRVFDVDQALESALELFWRHGYEGTSLAMLTKAMGINTPSLYAAFGNKEALFGRVLEHYLESPVAYMSRALEEPTARRVAQSVLEGAINLTTHPDHPAGGCLLVRGAMATGPVNEPIRQQLTATRAGAEAALRARFERAVEEGDLPPSADAAHLARYLMTLICGFSVQAAGGATRSQLEEVAQIALCCWPTQAAANAIASDAGSRPATST